MLTKFSKDNFLFNEFTLKYNSDTVLTDILKTVVESFDFDAEAKKYKVNESLRASLTIRKRGAP